MKPEHDDSLNFTSKVSHIQEELEVTEAKAIVLSCMDVKLLEDVVRRMDVDGYNNSYDQFILAGASLGYNQAINKYWSDLFNQHVKLAIELHHVKEIVVIDHDKCTAYKKFLPPFKPDEEKRLHTEQIKMFEENIKAIPEFKHLKVRGFFMHLDGEAEKLN